ncbi:hypothetical protein LOK49_LG01G02978 [Camellia lanceoleosa]|uniref:Uncharacterized protein n=1 Tax=Camellia lanceoleosa TaxID=1840588 RepID=A0ACC0J3X9_9ERIC|nr:hypothetical protein LOK49_LG01G02978 [Camellia lanceoleosa]
MSSCQIFLAREQSRRACRVVSSSWEQIEQEGSLRSWGLNFMTFVRRRSVLASLAKCFQRLGPTVTSNRLEEQWWCSVVGDKRKQTLLRISPSTSASK